MADAPQPSMIQRASRDVGLYALATVLARSTTLVLLPIQTRFLAPSEVGVVELLLVLMSVAGVIVSLQVTQALARFVPDDPDDASRRRIASTALWFSVTTYSAFAAIVILLADPIASLLSTDAAAEETVIVAAIATWIGSIFIVVQGQLRWELRVGAYATTSVLFSFATLLATVAMLATIGGPPSVFLGQFVGAALALSVAGFLARRSFALLFDGDSLRRLLAFSLPLVPSSVGVVLMVSVDRLAIGAMLPIEDVGFFAVGARIASIAGLAVAGVQLALTPLIYATYRLPEAPAELARLFRNFAGVAFLLVLGLFAFAQETVAILSTPAYAPATQVVGLLTVAVLLNGMSVFAPGLGIALRTWRIAAISLGGAVLNTALNLALIPILGISGAALATVVSAGVVFAISMAESQRYYPVPHNWAVLALGVVLSAGVVGALIVFDATGFGWFAIRSAALVVAVIALMKVGLLEPEPILRAARAGIGTSR